MKEETRKLFDLAEQLPPAERMELARELMRSAASDNPAFADAVGEVAAAYDPFPSPSALPSSLAFTLEYWQDRDWYVGRLREVPGVFSQGESLAALEENIRDAYGLMVADPAETPAGAETRRKRLEVA